MRPVFILFLALAILLSIACGGEQTVPTTSAPSEPTAIPVPDEPAATEEPTAQPTPTPTPEPTPTATPVPEPTATPEPTPTPQPTQTPIPTATSTPEPTSTPLPTVTPTHTATPRPTLTPTPRPTRIPWPTLTPGLPVLSMDELPQLDPAEIEKLIFEIQNAVRETEGVGVLIWDEDIAKIARRHSGDMADLGVLEHRPFGLSATDRALLSGYDCEILTDQGTIVVGFGENISRNSVVKHWFRPTAGAGPWYADDYSDEQGMAEDMVQGWLTSTKGHREILLSPDYRRAGVGVVIVDEVTSIKRGPHPRVYATVDFSRCG